jgi:murein DD-endopeptidase MepM/ murein hydrolase activator NlpD
VSPAVRPIAPALQPHGTVYRVQRGETLWRIARDFGVDIRMLARANQISHPSQLKAGEQLLIPLPQPSGRFLWPARGSCAKVAIGSTKALDIQAPSGTIVRASRSGRVAVSAGRLADLGRTVVLDHGDGFLTIYGRMADVAVAPGTQAAQGVPLGRMGASPLYFEVRQGMAARDPIALLP